MVTAATTALTAAEAESSSMPRGRWPLTRYSLPSGQRSLPTMQPTSRRNAKPPRKQPLHIMLHIHAAECSAAADEAAKVAEAAASEASRLASEARAARDHSPNLRNL